MITLRPYQELSLQLLWSYFASGNVGNPLIAYPTGTGKSCLPAIFIHRIMQYYPNQRFLLMTHSKELIQQNYEVLKFAWPEAPVGIYSAGLGKKDIAHPIIYGGIQSMIKNPSLFGFRDMIFIDEAHLVSQEDSSMYLTFIATAKLINPHIKVVGMTATPFRMGQGLLTDSGLFTDIIHDLTSLEEFNKLIANEYMSPLIPKRTHTELDVSNVSISKGEFIGSQLQHAVDIESITHNALVETCEIGQNRKSWLIFSSGIEHANHISEMLRSFGIDCASVHSKQRPDYNDAAIKAFKSNSLRSIVNFGKLTTGFNHPSIDLISDLRPTMSIPLHIQKLGRGTRPAPGKSNCVVLDFGRNVPRLGPINDPIIPRKKGEGAGELPIKICDECGTYNHARVQFCINCNHEFQFKIKLVPTSGSDVILRDEMPIVETFDVDRVIYNRYNPKSGGAACIKATYNCGLRSFNEYKFPEGKAYSKHQFHQWWRERNRNEPPLTANDALPYLSQLRCPARIRVWVNKNHPEILGVEF